MRCKTHLRARTQSQVKEEAQAQRLSKPTCSPKFILNKSAPAIKP